MPSKKYALQATPEHQGKRLDQVLAEWLPYALSEPLSKSKIRKLIVAGAVYLNGKRVRIASKTIFSGAKLEAFIDLEKLNRDATAQDMPFRMTEKDILFEDEYLIAVDKPPGLPTQPTLDEARENLFAVVRKYLRDREGSPKVYLGLHHRLDRDTSGVVLFTKREEANAGTAALFSEHLAQKIYHALTWKPAGAIELEQEWTIKNYLAKSKEGGKRGGYRSVRSGGDFAHTDFTLLEATSSALYVEARPKTGRTHQIRVHLSENGMPILGDPLYRDASRRTIVARRLMLHAVSLTFPHPIHKTRVSVQSPLPEDFVQCLQAIRRGPI